MLKDQSDIAIIFDYTLESEHLRNSQISEEQVKLI